MLQLNDNLRVTSIIHDGDSITSLTLEKGGLEFVADISLSQRGCNDLLSTRKNLQPTIETAPSVASAVLEVHAGDAIRLIAHNEQAAATLHTHGVWWRVHAGYRGGTHWLLNSISKQPRKAGSKVYHQLIINKVGDPNYEIDQVCTFPREFVYKEWAKS